MIKSKLLKRKRDNSDGGHLTESLLAKVSQRYAKLKGIVTEDDVLKAKSFESRKEVDLLKLKKRLTDQIDERLEFISVISELLEHENKCLSDLNKDIKQVNELLETNKS
jgi:uncharacterized protein (DUF2344 family)